MIGCFVIRRTNKKESGLDTQVIHSDAEFQWLLALLAACSASIEGYLWILRTSSQLQITDNKNNNAKDTERTL